MRVALGTVQFGLPYGIANETGQVGRLEAKEMLHLAEVSGIDMLDTAIAYGESEACLGAAGVQSFKVVTKLPALPDSVRDVRIWVREQVGLSLQRLGVTCLYGLLLHRSADLLGNRGQELWHAMEELRGDGSTCKIGASIYAPLELDAVTKQYDIDLVQAPFNILDRRLRTSGWLDRLKDMNVEVHTRSAFLQGLLLMPLSSVPPKFLSRWNGLFLRWHQWLCSYNITAVQACLSFSLSQLQIDKVIVGADGKLQLQEIVDFANCAFPDFFPDLQTDDESLVNPALWRTF